ncbi:MarR family transcriptional regulator [Hoyosella sp. G463]|uniref:MarR family transcriptional regulator n=1 Tax=Lolliginicoccus lacisalsi TaxID=2742202 RepID=A0A927JB30_9ACTN|nr:MarR family transcriptional regulator [Lolliginicoccus lacisalsi]
MSDEDKQLAGDLALAVVRLARYLRGHQDHASALSLTQVSVLTAICYDGPMTPTELAHRERVQPPSMTRTIASLINAGLAQRLPHPTDGRQALISLTEAGREATTAEKTARDGWLEQQLASLDPGQREILRAALPTMNTLITRTIASRGAARPMVQRLDH